MEATTMQYVRDKTTSRSSPKGSDKAKATEIPPLSPPHVKTSPAPFGKLK